MSVGAVVAAITAHISALPDIGLVFDHDPWDRENVRNVLVSTVAGRDTLRAWWVSGPVLAAAYEDEASGMASLGNMALRRWTYTIHGVEGLAPAYPGDTRGPGGDLLTLRANGEAITNALDADVLLGGTCATTEPCSWPAPPAHRTFAGLVAVSYLAIVKTALTLESP
ncbi:MAG: hypothetical protein QOD63_2211 [Actinomycetota bacterium]|jgi:hypothetical protein|nr:hypothetical protein [Actinomycetota bacterium]